MRELFDSYDPVEIKSHPGVRTDLFRRDLSEVLITDFFGSVQRVEVDDEEVKRKMAEEDEEWERDMEGLRRLVEEQVGSCGNRSEGRVEKTEKTEKVDKVERGEGVKRRKGGPVKMEEGGNRWRELAGLGAVVACFAVWVVGSAL